ncbi:hypothetical protein [Roseivivax sp. THAF30]|uniref:hypothetical protein n=1 Tax=Roseivivax sp. THAF30 TaxID=2587852 RepID=UPI00126964B3|nr:hypothetical protein [Roseivivax sp. THAF30]QFT63996.1 hypothetical protein FIU91_13740 [Roseivivax sp. THAF30]
MSGVQDDDPLAWEIAKELLQRTGRALESRDFPLMLSAFHLPYTHVTTEGVVVLNSEDDFRTLFANVRAHFEGLGMTHLDREVISASFVSTYCIRTTHRSRIMKGETLLNEPYETMAEIVRRNHRWGIACSNYGVQNDKAHQDALLSVRFPDEKPFRLMN